VNFELDETQEAVRGLAGQIFRGSAPVERVKEVEASDERIDRELWAELAKSDVLGLALPEASGGGGLGMVELALVLEQQGRQVAPVPLLATVVAAQAIAEFGSDDLRSQWLPKVIAGEAILALGFTAADVTADGDTITGTAVAPHGHAALRVLVPTPTGVYVVDPADAVREVNELTDRSKAAWLTFDRTPAQPLGDCADWILDRYRTGLAALQVGVCGAALDMTAEYVSNRNQFGRPLSTNQGVALRAADAYIDIRAIEAVLWQAAWRLDEGLDARKQAMVAQWWAAEAGQRVVHATQHLHGGMGADIDYPVHRYFLWGKTIEHLLGGPAPLLEQLGEELAS
jgi:3-oxocholest-4-en-26-oyl-CoA dehydrogenase beta subunit